MVGLMLCGASLVVRATDKVPVALQMLADEASSGDPSAQLLYGLAFLKGQDGLSPNARKGVHWLRRAGRADNAYAQLLLGNCYADGTGVDKDPAQAVRWWRQATGQDNAQAQYLLGKALLEGQGVGKDPGQAIEWLTKSADQGDKDAQYLIGKMYHDGYAVAQDSKIARDWLSRAAEQGHSDAINLLAGIKEALDLTTMGYQQSLDVLQPLAEQGDPQAGYELGLRYESGAWDVEQDNGKALEWITRSAQAGNHVAMKTLADIYRHGDLGLKPDPEQAQAWDAKAQHYR